MQKIFSQTLTPKQLKSFSSLLSFLSLNNIFFLPKNRRKPLVWNRLFLRRMLLQEMPDAAKAFKELHPQILML